MVKAENLCPPPEKNVLNSKNILNSVFLTEQQNLSFDQREGEAVEANRGFTLELRPVAYAL